MPIKPRSSGVSGGYSDTLPQTLMNNRLRRGGQDAAILGLTFCASRGYVEYRSPNPPKQRKSVEPLQYGCNQAISMLRLTG